MSNFRQYWVGLNMVKGIGAVRIRAMLVSLVMLNLHGRHPPDALRSTGLPKRIIDNLIKLRASVSLDEIFERIQAQNIQVLIWDDDGYPVRLRNIGNPPPVLYVRGSVETEDEWSVAIVGTRRLTPYGRQVAERIAVKFAYSAITVVSGLALGIDTVAHHSSLDAGGRSLAVLGSGDRVYPSQNRGLAGKLIENGALISDYAPDTPPEASNFIRVTALSLTFLLQPWLWKRV